MKRVRVAFDIDGVLRSSEVSYKHASLTDVVPNPRMVELLKTMAGMKNVDIIVWSGGGEQYCRQIARILDIEKYVYAYISKAFANQYESVDIAFDDQHEFALAEHNIIVREK